MRVVMFPGQGAQYKGMGKNLFPKYKKEIDLASSILGYDLEDLCVNDPDRKLVQTQFTQPALYVVNALNYYEQGEKGKPDFFVGHSLGEYNALLAADVFSFETGLRLVQKRGGLMASASSGSMAAVLGLKAEVLSELLVECGYGDIDIANYNTHSQAVIAGPQETVNRIVKDFDKRGIKIIPLMVSAPFHSRYMKPVAEKFRDFLKDFEFRQPSTPVVSNVTALPYNGEVRELLSSQIKNSVLWTDTICYLLNNNCENFEQAGGGTILCKMVDEIKNEWKPLSHAGVVPSSSSYGHVNNHNTHN